jgi:hypothetical protein
MDKLIFAATKLMLVVALLLSNTPYPAKVLAQDKTPSTSKKPDKKPNSPQINKPRIGFVWPKTPPGLTGVLGRPTGAASRGCFPDIQSQSPLTALVPFKKQDLATKQKDKSGEIDVPMNVWGLTTSERPSFWFYVPYTKDVANLSAEFVLLEHTGKDVYGKKVYRNAIALPLKPGIISVSLPSTVAPLQVDKTYRWYFNIYCRPSQTGNSSVMGGEADLLNVEGDIHRVNPNPEVAQQLAVTSDPRVKIAIYAAAGIWYDSLTLLAQLRLVNPNDVDLATDWQTLLESIKLSQISDVPLLN